MGMICEKVPLRVMVQLLFIFICGYEFHNFLCAKLLVLRVGMLFLEMVASSSIISLRSIYDFFSLLRSEAALQSPGGLFRVPKDTEQ